MSASSGYQMDPTRALATTTDRPDGPAKRVRRACGYCRKKRLKCTADMRPCLNCQLYGAECSPPREVSNGRRRRERTATISQTANTTNSASSDGVPAQEQPPSSSQPAAAQVSFQDGIATLSPQPCLLAQDPPPGLASPEPASLSTFEQAIDPSLDVLPNFWGFDNFLPICNPPDEQVIAEQLLALQNSPTSQSVPDGIPPPPTGSKNSSSGAFGTDGVVFHSPSGLGAVSSGIFKQNEVGNSQFLGFTSTAAILALCVRHSDGTHGTHGRLSSSESLQVIADCGPMCDEISCPAIEDTPVQHIPSATLAAQSVKNFFDDYHASYPIADRDQIGAIVDRYVCHGHQSLRHTDRSMLYLITALGTCSRPTANSSKSIDIDNLYSLAWNLFPHAVAAPSFASVQVLLLHVLYNMHWCKWGIAWVLCGLAVRIAQSVGLHLVLPEDAGLAQEQRKSRARLWAVTLILDAQLSLSQGKVSAYFPSDNDAKVLANSPQLLHVSELCSPLSEILIWRSSLARIQQRLTQAFSAGVSSEQHLCSLEKIDLDLLKWKDDLPPEFRPGQQMFLDGDMQIDIYLLHLDYFNLLQTVHWGIFTRWPETSLKEHTAPRLRASGSTNLSACLSLVQTLNAMNDGNSRTRSFRSRSDHFISAFATIYRHICCDPGKFSARMNLEYMRVIRLHLISMANEHLLTASLTNLINNMAKSAEDLVADHEKSLM